MSCSVYSLLNVCIVLWFALKFMLGISDFISLYYASEFMKEIYVDNSYEPLQFQLCIQTRYTYKEGMEVGGFTNLILISSLQPQSRRGRVLVCGRRVQLWFLTLCLQRVSNAGGPCKQHSLSKSLCSAGILSTSSLF